MNRHRPLIALVAFTILLGAGLTGCRPKIYNDGTYKGISQADAQHGYAIAEVTLQRDRITAVKLTEVTELGVTRDYAAYPYAKAKEANTEIAKRFIGRQDSNVDTYAGATSSSKKYIEAVSYALEKARKTPTVKTTYFSGTYMGRSKAGDKGYGIALVTLQGDKITAVKLDDVTEAGTLKDWATFTYPKALEAKGVMEKRFVEKNSATVDTYATATQSSAKWVQAVQDALTNAKVR